MRNKREIEGISLSFLDVISCGFGAIILLLVMPIFNTVPIEDTVSKLEGYLAALQEELFDLRGEAKDINRKMIRKEDPQSEEIARLLRLNAELSALKSKHKKMLDKTKVATLVEGKLVEAKQSLTDEMKKLLVDYQPIADENKIGGIPVDSEYIIFIIDTSPSMYVNSWPLVLQMVTETLKVYPNLKGFQVLDDMGEPITQGYSGGNFIPYSKLDQIIRLMSTWPTISGSNSNPTEGIIKAINDYHHPNQDKKISLYVYGDDFSPLVTTDDFGRPISFRKRDINRVLKTIQTANTQFGKPKVRIHAVAFPVFLIAMDRKLGRNSRFDEYTIDFTILMRTLAEKNEGTFVGLNRLTP